MKNKYVVVSLFDGLSGGRIALQRAGVEVLRYYSAEIDKYAISIADKNWPEDTSYRLGDVTQIDAVSLRAQIDKEFPDAKVLLIGGSPCTGFSLAGRQKGMTTADNIEVTTLEQYIQLKDAGVVFDGQSYLFWEYVRIKEELSPDFFFLENVRVQKKWRESFDTALGTAPIEINSSIVSAQNRVRYYWTNITNDVPLEDKELVLTDILEPDTYVDGTYTPSESKVSTNGLQLAGITTTGGVHESTRRVYTPTGKAPTVTAIQGGGQHPKVALKNTTNGKAYALTATYSKAVAWNSIQRKQRTMVPTEDTSKEPYDGNYWRKLSPLECERLQTLPDNYTEGVSKSQRYKMIGNGWTIDVVVGFFKQLP